MMQMFSHLISHTSLAASIREGMWILVPYYSWENWAREVKMLPGDAQHSKDGAGSILIVSSSINALSTVSHYLHTSQEEESCWI